MSAPPEFRVGNSSDEASAFIQFDSTTRASIPIPRMTTTQRNAIATPVKGDWVFDITLNAPFYHDGTAWRMVSYGTAADLSTVYQPLDTDLTAIAALAGTGFARQAGAGSWSIVGETGTGNVVRASAPSLVTPALGVATGEAITLTNSVTTTAFNSIGDGIAALFAMTSYNGSGTLTNVQAGANLRRAQGSLAAPAIVVNGDTLASLGFQGYDGTTFRNAISILATVANTPGANSIPGKLVIEAIQNVGDTARKEYLGLAGAALVINEGANDIDFRVEGDTDANLLVTDASTDCVGVKTNAPTAALDINSDILRLRTAKTPASAAAAGNAGDFCWDSGFLYICTATNTWERVAVASW